MTFLGLQCGLTSYNVRQIWGPEFALSSYNRFIRGKRFKSQVAKSWRMMVGDQTLLIENTVWASLLQLQYAAEDLSWRTTIPENNIPRLFFFWIKTSNYSTHSTFGGTLYLFRHVYGLTTSSELTSALCRDRRAY